MSLTEEESRPARLFTVGEALAVLVAQGDESLADSVTFRRFVGGAESNIATGFVRLGHKATYVTKVGSDGLGDAIARAYETRGVDASVSRSSLPTGTIIRTPGTSDGIESVHLRIRSAATELSAADIDAAWPERVSAVFVTGITAIRSEGGRAAVERTVELAKRDGALVVVDPNFRSQLGTLEQFGAALEGLRGRVDIAIGDLDELAAIAGTGPDSAVQALLDAGALIVVTKRGARGAVANTPFAEFEVGSQAASVADTVGAGDAFAAGFIAGLIEQKSIPESLELASSVAARVVESLGDVEGFPARDTLARETIDA